MNLGWKLAAVVQGRAPEALLDTYHFERHPVGSDLLKHTLAQTALIATFSPEGLALRDMLAELVNHTPALSERLATTLSGLGVAYPSPDPFAHPLTGQRAPDLRVGERGLFSLLGRPLQPSMTFTNARKSIWAFEGSQEDLGHPGTELRAAQQQVLQQQCRQALNSGLPPRVLPRKGVVPSTLWLVVASHRGRD